MQLEGRTALVTGAGRGIGRGCAVELARAGAELILNDRAGSEDIAKVAEEIAAMGRRVSVVEGDVFSRAGCELVVSEATAASSSVDIFVSNPAWGKRCSFLDCSPEDFERVIQSTLSGGFHMGQLLARQMVAQGGGGKITFISSVQAEMPLAESVAYGAAKAGLNQMARTMAVELADLRINVNVIEPGWIDTPGEHIAFSEEVIQQEGAALPWGRLGTPADIGRAAVFLSSDGADYITGSVLAVDGGFRTKHCRAENLIQAKTE